MSPAIGGRAPAGVRLPDRIAVADLATLVWRARKVDPDGAARLRAHGDVLAVFVCPIRVPGAPLVLGLRTMHLAAPSEVDVTVPLAALADACARVAGPGPAGAEPVAGGGPGEPVEVTLPTAQVTAVWAGVSPPREGWAEVGRVEVGALLEAARAGAAEIAAGTPADAGAAAVARLRSLVWGRPLPGVSHPGGDGPPGGGDLPGTGAPATDVPAGMAFAADVLGFARDGDPPAPVHRAGRWSRLSTPRGYLLARTPTLRPGS